MKLNELLRSYAQYNVWANNRFRDFIEGNLNEEQVNKEISSSFPSILKTTYHIWDAEHLWLQRLNGTSLKFGISSRFSGTYPETLNAWIENSKDFSSFVSKQEIAFFEKEMSYKRINGEQYQNQVSEMIHHCMNHSTFHRGQLITMLRQLGFTKLFETDYISWTRNRN